MRCPPSLEILPRDEPIGAESGDPLFYVVQRVPAITGNDLRSARHSLDEFNRPAVGFTLKPDAAERFGAFTAQQHPAVARDRAGQPRHVGRDDSVPHRRSGTDRRRQPGGDDRAGHQPELGRAARGPRVRRGAHHRREPRRRVDSRRRAGVARRPRPRPGVHARLLPAGRRQRARLGGVEPAHPAGDHGLHPGDAHAAGHRGPDPDDRHGRRFERADLRAAQGGARHRPRPAAAPSRPPSRASG